jgi:hypothetical protein
VDDGAFRVTLVGSPMTLTLAHEAGRAAPPWLRRLATDAPQLADRLGAAELARGRHPLTPCGREVLRVDVRLVDVARLNDARALRSRSLQVGLFEREDAYAVVWVGWQSERESLLTAVHELAHLVHATRCDRRGGGLSGSEAFAERVEEAATRAW